MTRRALARRLRARIAAAGLAMLLPGLARAAAAQASAYIPLDDPRLPLLEHLIARGDVEDPYPQVRPIRRLDAVHALQSADSVAESPSGRIIRQLLTAYSEDTIPESRWAFEARLGGQAQNQKRRDQLRLGGAGSVNPYLDVGLTATFGPAILVTRPAVEPRLIGDPDWPSTQQEHLTGRLIEGYAGVQWRWGEVLYGQLDRNWGPADVWGLALSNYGYERQTAAVQIGRKQLRLVGLGGDLNSEVRSDGQTVNRFLFAHRLDWRISRRFTAAVWETTLVTGVGRGFEIWYRNLVAPSVLTNGFGIRQQNETANTIIGADLAWRPGGGLLLQGSFMLDDLWFNKRDENRDRWGLTLAAAGPLGRTLSWRALYTQVSSLALRTFDPFERYADANVGIGRNFTDNDQASLFVSIPLLEAFLITPELSFVRQGEGRLNDPYPQAQPTPGFDYPGFLVGTVERTYRVGVGVAGQVGPLAVQARTGLNHFSNAGHVPGASRTRVLAALQATLAWSRRGRLDL